MYHHKLLETREKYIVLELKETLTVIPKASIKFYQIKPDVVVVYLATYGEGNTHKTFAITRESFDDFGTLL